MGMKTKQKRFEEQSIMVQPTSSNKVSNVYIF